MSTKARRRPMWKKKGPDARAYFIREYSKKDFETLTRSMTKYRDDTESFRKAFVEYGELLFREDQ